MIKRKKQNKAFMLLGVILVCQLLTGCQADEVDKNTNNKVEVQVNKACTHNIETKGGVLPTCTKTGLTEIEYCTLCNEEFTEQETIPVTEHSFVVTDSVKATCTEPGKVVNKCQDCGYEVVEKTKALGHYQATKKAVAATCSTTGLTEGIYCKICREVLIPQASTETLPHTLVADPKVDPTCEAKGLTAGSHCTKCSYEVKQKSIAALGHDYESSVTRETTCAKKGEITFVCKNCKDTYTKDIDKLDHKEVDIPAVEPTCTKEGATAGKKCSVCDTVTVKPEAVKAIGHVNGNKDNKCDKCEEVIVTLDDIVGLTNKDTVVISGKVVELDNISKLLVNDTEIKFDKEGKFSVTVSINEGNNTIKVQAITKDKIEYIISHDIIKDVTKPTVTTDLPDFVSMDQLTVKITVKDVNGIKSVEFNDEALIGTNGIYTTQLVLTEEETSVVIKVTDKAGNQTTLTEKVILDNVTPSLTIEDTPKLTNTDKLTINGSVSDKNIDVVSINNAIVTVDDDGKFSKELTLFEGSNTITVHTKDKAGNVKDAEKTVIYDKTNPALTMADMPDMTISPSIIVSGIATDANGIEEVTINDNVMTLDLENRFSLEVDLIEGDNEILIKATDKAGNIATITENVMHDATVPELIINDIESAVSHDILTITGKATDSNGIVNVKVNNNEALLDTSGNFSYDLLLEVGINTINIIATDKSGQTTLITKTVVYDNIDPTIEVTVPEYTSQINYEVTGIVSDNDKIESVTVNNIPAEIDNNGTFKVTVPLQESEYNDLTFVVTDRVGNTITTVKSIFQDGVNPVIVAEYLPEVTQYGNVSVLCYVTDNNYLQNVRINGKEVYEQEQGVYYREIFLAEGDNEITILALDNAMNQAIHKIHIYYDSTSPVITLDEVNGLTEANPVVVNTTSYVVSGEVTDNYGIATVDVNGTPVVLDSSNRFSYTVELNPLLTNAITVNATDDAGNTISATRYVSVVTN